MRCVGRPQPRALASGRERGPEPGNLLPMARRPARPDRGERG